MPRAKELRKLYRSENDRIIAGVAGGIGEYAEIDPTIIRIIFVLLTVFGGSGILIYIILWILIPYEHDSDKSSDEKIRKNTYEMRDRAKNFASDLKDISHDDSRNWFAFLIIVIGILFLFGNFGFFRFDLFWPVILIALGIFLLFREH